MSGGAWGIVAFVATILVMTTVHEFGHFLAAKRFGMKVEEFFVGFGPRLVSKRKGETEYGIKFILLGGYVKIAGMNPWQTVPESEVPRTYGAKPAWQRAILLCAGSATHLVLATLMLWALFGAVGISSPTTKLASVQQELRISEDEVVEAPARAAGLESGDRITTINGVKVERWEQFQRVVRASAGKEVTIGVERKGDSLEFLLTPVAARALDAEGREMTVGLVGVNAGSERDALPPHTAFWEATKTTGGLVVESVKVIGKVFSPAGIGRIFSSLTGSGQREIDQPIGLVGAGRIAGQAASGGEIESLIFLLSSFVVIVGVANMLPLPPLDGGHLLLLLIERVRRKRIDLRKVVPVAVLVIGFFLLIFVALLYLDIVRPVTNPFQ